MNPWDVLVQHLENVMKSDLVEDMLEDANADITSENVSSLRRVIGMVLYLIKRARIDENVSEEDSEEDDSEEEE